MAFSFRNPNPYEKQWVRPLASSIPTEIKQAGPKLDRACEKTLPLLDVGAADQELVAAFVSEGFSESSAKWLLPYLRQLGSADRLRDALISPPWEDYDPTSAFHTLLWWCVKPWRGAPWIAVPMLLIAVCSGLLAAAHFGDRSLFFARTDFLIALGVGTATLFFEGLISKMIGRVVMRRRNVSDR